MKNKVTIEKRLLIGALFLCTLTPASFAQIKGKVIDASNSEALFFANIAVADKEISAAYPGGRLGWELCARSTERKNSSQD